MASNKDMSSKPSAMNTGMRATYWNAEHETWVTVYDGILVGLDTDAGRWQVVCERHGSILTVETLKLAHEDARHDPADFCEDCRDAKVAPCNCSACVDEREHEKASEARRVEAANVLYNAVQARAGHTAAVTTDAEVDAVVAWCREWANDCQWIGPSPDQTFAKLGAAYFLRRCDERIDGGLAFVLEDVRRCAEVHGERDAALAETAEVEGDADTLTPGGSYTRRTF